MAKAEATFSEPVVLGVVLTLTTDEAYLLREFLGATQIGVVQELLPYISENKQNDVNNVLYNSYTALNGVLGEQW